MLLLTFLQKLQCFDLFVLKDFARSGIKYIKKRKASYYQQSKSQIYNNIFISTGYFNNFYRLDSKTEVVIVKHIYKKGNDQNQTHSIVTKEAKVSETRIDLIKLAQFIHWYYNNKKFEHFYGGKHSQNITCDEILKDFDNKEFTLQYLLFEKSTYYNCLRFKSKHKKNYFKGINENYLIPKMMNCQNLWEIVTYEELKKQFDIFSTAVIDLSKHIRQDEECVFGVYIKNKNDYERISQYFYHYKGIFYENNALNTMIHCKKTKIINDLIYINLLFMKITNYSSINIDREVQLIISEHERMNNIIVKQKTLDFGIVKTSKDQYHRIIQ